MTQRSTFDCHSSSTLDRLYAFDGIKVTGFPFTHAGMTQHGIADIRFMIIDLKFFILQHSYFTCTFLPLF